MLTQVIRNECNTVIILVFLVTLLIKNNPLSKFISIRVQVQTGDILKEPDQDCRKQRNRNIFHKTAGKNTKTNCDINN